MGPRLVNRGKLTRRCDRKPVVRASMGPRLVNRGKEGFHRGRTYSTICFNGAAVG